MATNFQFLGNSFKNITISNLNIGKNFQIYVGMTWAEFEQDFFANIWNSFSKTWNPGIIFPTVFGSILVVVFNLILVALKVLVVFEIFKETSNKFAVKFLSSRTV